MNTTSRLFVAMVLLLALAIPYAAAEKNIKIIENTLTIAGNPGTAVTGTFTVLNNGTEVLNIVFSSSTLVFGTNTIAAPFIPAVTVLEPGAVAHVNYTVNLAANQATGVYTGEVNATDGTATDTIAISLGVNAVPNMGISPTAISATAARGYSEQKSLTVTNSGNTDLASVVVSFSDLTKVGGTDILAATNIAVSANAFALAHGNSRTLTVTATVPADTPLGTYSGTYQVVSGSVIKSGTTQIVVVEPIGHVVLPTSLEYTNVVKSKTYTEVFTITNDGSFDLGGITITSTVDAKYNLSFANVPTTLAKGISRQITMTFTVPSNEATGLHQIGTVTFDSDKTDAVAIPLKIQPTMMLKLKNLYLYVDSKRNSINYDVTDDKTNAKPDSKLQFKADVENLYTNDEDINIDDVTMKVTIVGIDDGDDLEDETNGITVHADDKETLTLDFNVPTAVDAKTYTVDIHFEGQDENGNDQILDYTTKLVIEKDTHDVRITTFDLSKATISCDLTDSMDVKIVNFGQREEDEVLYTIKNSDLGINIVQGGVNNYIDLVEDPFDSDNTFSKTHTISLPSNTKPGTYTLDMKVYMSGSDEADSQTVSLTVQKCQEDVTPAPSTTPTTTAPVDVVVPPVTPPVTPGPVVAEQNSDLFSGINQWYLIGILGGVFLLVLIIVIVLVATRR